MSDLLIDLMTSIENPYMLSYEIHKYQESQLKEYTFYKLDYKKLEEQEVSKIGTINSFLEKSNDKLILHIDTLIEWYNCSNNFGEIFSVLQFSKIDNTNPVITIEYYDFLDWVKKGYLVEVEVTKKLITEAISNGYDSQGLSTYYKWIL